jgi:predicted nuclease of restriction endonuclease-like (RecB) superfamily
MSIQNSKLSLENYQLLLAEVANLVQNHRIIAIQSVQTISNQLYWNIGELIIKKQDEFGWGYSIVKQMSLDLPKLIGDGISWSPRNLWLMRQFVQEYSNMNQVDSQHFFNGEILPENVKVNQTDSLLENVKKLLFEVPWQHNVLIFQKIKDLKARIFYLEQTIRNRYSRSVLLHQIKANAFEKYLQKPTQSNFSKALPEHVLKQAEESIKSVYSLDFLDINIPISERELENSMVEKVKRLMLELGYGFCFIGNQYRISLGDKDYYIDLLFYHRILKCLVAVELKVTEFEPEFVGKLDFYLQLIDEQLKQPDDKPSIGILLVPEKNHLEVEYALRSANKPIGVSEYILSKELPSEFIGKLPTVEQFNKIF